MSLNCDLKTSAYQQIVQCAKHISSIRVHSPEKTVTVISGFKVITTLLDAALKIAVLLQYWAQIGLKWYTFPSVLRGLFNTIYWNGKNITHGSLSSTSSAESLLTQPVSVASSQTNIWTKVKLRVT